MNQNELAPTFDFSSEFFLDLDEHAKKYKITSADQLYEF